MSDKCIKSPRSKTELLKDVHFLSSVEADLTDVTDYTYPERVSIPSQLTKEEVVAVIMAASKDKALGPDEILNRVLQRVAGAAPELLTRIF
jgi:hypothetical protein